MKTINRTVLTIFPKQPYIDWANSFEDDGPKMDAETKHSTAVLIPDRYDEYTYEKFLKKIYSKIFQEELAAWMDDPEAWPQDRSYKRFNEWFDIRVSDAVIDLGSGQIRHEVL
jgi:hypothetical protein